MAVSIETEELRRYFGSLHAVDGVSFRVSEGEVLGFLGPNGAGKSTTMKLLTCFLKPTSGTARVGGYDITTHPREVQQQIGYLPENAPLYGEMEVAAFLRFIAEVRGFSGPKREESVERVIHLTTLGNVTSQRIETLSKGFKRRVGLAQALIHDPSILILDEPTDGLDPNQKFEVRQLINKMAKDKCIILSTHILEEVDEVCTRAIIIAQGKLVADDTPDGLRKRSKSAGTITISFKKPVPSDVRQKLLQVAGVRNIQEKHRGDKSIAFMISHQEGSNVLRELVRSVDRESWQFDDLRIESGALDEVFRTITTTKVS